MFFEMKKFYKTTAVLISFGVALLIAICMPILFIHSYESYDYSTGKEVVKSGLGGLKYEKEQLQKVSGVLTTDKLNEALDFYKLQPEGDKAYFKMEDKYPRLFSLMTESYTPYGRYTFDINKLSNANDFYTNNIERVKEKIDLLEKKVISSKEREEALKKADNIKKPYTFEFVDQWPILIKSLLFVYIVIILSSLLISSKIFSFEKENNMDIILNSAGRKKLVYIGLKKILAMISYLSLEFILCTVITTTIVLGLIGVDGWNSQVQILPQFSTVIYSWSIGEMFVYYLIIAWISIISIALIGALINSILQETYTSLIISSLLMISPIFLRNNLLLQGIEKFLYVQPINGVSLLHFIDNLFVYHLGFCNVLSACVIVITSIIYSIIGIIFAPIVFSRRINKKILTN